MSTPRFGEARQLLAGAGHTPNGSPSARARHRIEHGAQVLGYEQRMATRKQTRAAKKNIEKASKAARQQRSPATMPRATRTALGKQGAAVAQRRRTGSSTPRTRQELYDEATRRNLHGRSTMGRDELARALGHG